MKILENLTHSNVSFCCPVFRKHVKLYIIADSAPDKSLEIATGCSHGNLFKSPILEEIMMQL